MPERVSVGYKSAIVRVENLPSEYAIGQQPQEACWILLRGRTPSASDTSTPVSSLDCRLLRGVHIKCGLDQLGGLVVQIFRYAISQRYFQRLPRQHSERKGEASLGLVAIHRDVDLAPRQIISFLCIDTVGEDVYEDSSPHPYTYQSAFQNNLPNTKAL